MIHKRRTILVAEDDDDDRLLTRDAFRESGVLSDIHFVENGEQLLSYLHRRHCAAQEPLPSMILLDLNLPIVDGREALREIRREHTPNALPVVILTTSKSPIDMRFTFEMGASLYITKPSSYKYFVRALGALMELDMNRLPESEGDYVFRCS